MRVATYARYSSENQRDASNDDQLRDNRALCAAQGWPMPVAFTDSEISGERRDRPGYLALLSAAAEGRIDLLVVWDLKRLSRGADLPQLLERFKFWGVRVVTCDGFDSSREGADMRGWIDGLMGNRYLRDLAKATHRGLAGRVLDGARAGGRPYGYRTTATAGELAIDEQQAAIVRRIYAAYLAGKSARQIAAVLNAEGVPSTRGGTWSASAIHGDTKRGIGILTNPVYAGRVVWNRSQWVKHPETGRRIRRERPESEWISADRPDLAIVTRQQWDRVQAQLERRRVEHKAHQRRVQHILSGILRCSTCSGPLIAVDRYRYGCATNKDRGPTVCGNRLRIIREDAEQAVIAALRGTLLSPAAFEQFRKDVARELIATRPDTASIERAIAKARREVDNLLAAVRAGIISPSLKADLARAEGVVADQERALADARAHSPTAVITRLEERWQRAVAALGTTSSTNAEIRGAIVELIGEQIAVNEKGAAPECNAFPYLMPSLTVVAGAGFEPATFGL